MSILRKALATAALATALIASGAHAEPKRIALVVKALGNGFFEAANKGAQEAAKELGDVEIIYTGPTDDHRRRPDRGHQRADRPGGRRHRHLRQRPRRAGAGAQEGDGPRHQGHLAGIPASRQEGRLMHLNRLVHRR